jgi:hypothetical protein
LSLLRGDDRDILLLARIILLQFGRGYDALLEKIVLIIR